MKKLSLLILLLVITLKAHCLSYSVFVNGYWGEWKSFGYNINFYGNYGGFCLYEKNHHPSQFFFRFSIDNYQSPTKDQLKRARKSNTWFEYTGTVEYFVNDEYPTIEKQYLKPCFIMPYKPYSYSADGPRVKRTTRAKIKIAPYKDHPVVYNIWFDNVGFGINLETSYFKK